MRKPAFKTVKGSTVNLGSVTGVSVQPRTTYMRSEEMTGERTQPKDHIEPGVEELSTYRMVELTPKSFYQIMFQMPLFIGQVGWKTRLKYCWGWDIWFTRWLPFCKTLLLVNVIVWVIYHYVR